MTSNVSTRLLDRLSTELEARREQLALAGLGDFLRWRSAGGDAPWIVVLLDDYPAFREVAEQVEMGRPLERFNSLLQNGPAVGIHVVLSVSQGIDLRIREASLVPCRVFFRASDVSDYTMVEPSIRAADLPRLDPGRALVAGGSEVQVCWPEPERFEESATRWTDTPTERRPRPVVRLPANLTRDDLVAATGCVGCVERHHRRARGTGRVAGVLRHRARRARAARGRTDRFGAELHPARAHPRLVRRTGRVDPTTGRDRHPSQPAPSMGRDDRDATDDRAAAGDEAAATGPARVVVTTTGEQITAALDDLNSSPTPGDVLVIDDAETLSTVYGAAERIEATLRAAGERRTRVLVAARVNDLPGMFDPWSRYLVSLRRVVLLQPTVDDAFLFGTKLPVVPPPNVAGRGRADRRDPGDGGAGRTAGRDRGAPTLKALFRNLKPTEANLTPRHTGGRPHEGAR